MKTRHPNQQPESRDTMDDVLDSLLTGADQDLQASLEPVLNVDAGLDAILGHRTTLPRRTQPPITTPKSARLSSSVKSHANRALSVVTPFLTWLTLIAGIRSKIKITGTSPETTITDSGTYSVDEQITAVIKLVNRAYGSRFPCKTRDLDHGQQALRELQEGLAGRRLSRTEAAELIDRVETKLQSTPTINSRAWRWVSLLMSPLPAGASLLINREPTAAYTIFLFGSVVITLLVCVYEARAEEVFLSWRRKTAKLALAKLQQLRPAVKRLFDDTNDWSLNTSPR